MNKYITGFLGSAGRWIPLCISFLATALIIQDAFALRSEAVKDDELMQSLMNWIHPAALVFLALGYAVSILALFAGSLPKPAGSISKPAGARAKKEEG